MLIPRIAFKSLGMALVSGLFLACIAFATVGCQSDNSTHIRYRRPVDPFAASYPSLASPKHEESTTVTSDQK